MEIPIILFSILALISMGFLWLGITRRIPISIFVCGIFLFSIAIITDTIVISYSQTEQQNVIEDTVIFAQLQSNSNGNMAVGGVLRVGEHITSASSLRQLAINGIEVDLKRSNCGACGGNVIVGIQSTTAGTFTRSFGAIPVSSLTTSYQSFKVSLPDNIQHTLATDERIAVDISQTTGTGVGNTIDIAYQNTDVFDSVNTKFQSATAAVWADIGATDMKFSLYQLVSIIDNTIEPDTFEFTELYKIIMSIAGIMFMIISVLFRRELGA